MAITAGAKEYLRLALVRTGIPHDIADIVAATYASSNLSLGATSHDNAALDLLDTMRVSVGYPALGRTEATAALNLARLTGDPEYKQYPPCTVQTSTNYLKNV